MSFLNKHILLPAKEMMMGRPTLKVLPQLEDSQWWTPESLRAYQWNRLQELLLHSYAHVPFYQALFDQQGLRPESIQNLEDFQARVPILTTDALRTQTQSFYARSPKQRLVTVRTSGSTGQRLLFKMSTQTGGYHLANLIRSRRWWNLEPGDPELKFWGMASPFEVSVRGKMRAIARGWKDRLFSVSHFSAFDGSETALMKAYHTMLRRRPKLIFGYGVALFIFAKFIAENQLNLAGYTPAAIIYTSETLYPSQRDLIRNTFGGCPLVCEYGSVECGIMAYDCPEGSLHLMDETLFVEVVPEKGVQGDGEGAIVVTHLESHAFPLIRYKIGDLGILSDTPCACGRGLSVLKQFAGRANDLIQKPNGEYVHAELFDYVMRYQEGVRRYRVIEEGVGHIRMLLETGHALSSQKKESLQANLRKHIGAEFRVDVEETDHIPNEPSGKFRWVISKSSRS